MPSIRDWTWQYNTSSVAVNLACTMPNYEQGDLLVAICTADTGTQTWSCSGWNVLQSVTNTTNIAILYKIAGASEADPTFNYDDSETANVRLVSIQDVNTTTPFPPA